MSAQLKEAYSGRSENLERFSAIYVWVSRDNDNIWKEVQII